MTNFKNSAKKLVAVVIALTMLFSMCITAAVPVTADTATTSESSLIAATAADDYVTGRSYKTITDLEGGGVNIRFTQYSGYEPYHYGVNLGAFDGIKLHFSNYVTENTDATIYGHGKLLLMLADTSAGTASRGANPIKFKPEVLGILIDTVDGKLKLVEQDNEQISSYTVVKELTTSTVSALEYSNFTGKEFTVSFNKSGTNVVVEIVVDGTTVTGTLTAEDLAKFDYCPSDIATYVSVGGVDNVQAEKNTWSVNFLGYKKTYTNAASSQVAGGTVDNLISTIAALPDTITLADANAVLTAQALYDSFGSASKAEVTNAAKLESAFSALTALRETSLYAANATYYAAAPEYTNQFSDEAHRTLYTSKTEDGVLVDFNRAGTYGAEKLALRNTTLTGKYALDGLYVSFKNFTYTKQSDFYLAFSSGDVGDAWDGSAESAKEQLVLYMGQDTSVLMLAGCGMTAPISLGSNSIIKRSNLVGKDISFEWHKADNNDYYLYITVGTQVAGFRVDADMIAAATDLDVNNVRVTLSAPSYGNDFEVEIDGIYAETSSSVTNAMNAIAALSASSAEDAINSAYDAYIALSATDKQHVINYPELNALRQGLNTTDAYYVPTMDDVYDNSPASKALAASASETGGIKIDMNNSIFGMRTVLKDRYVAEDITLRFDNYNYNNGYTVVGLTSSVNTGAIWNYEAATGRFGAYFLIGYDNSVWVTVPYSAGTMQKIITSDLLSADNLMNKEFFVNFKCDIDTNEITFTITVDGQALSYELDNLHGGHIPGTNGTYSQSMDQFNLDNAQIVIQGVGNYDPTTGSTSGVIRQNSSIDLTGILFNNLTSTQKAAVDEVIAAINALPNEATLSIQEDVEAVWNQYFELTVPKVRAAVTNADKLIALHDAIFNLRKGDSIVTEYIDKDIASATIDNSSLVTPYKPDSEIAYDSTGYWPEYTKDLVMAEVNLKKASAGGTILAEDIEPMLKHLAETGVNGLWVLPIHDQGVDNTSIYCNYGPDTICPYLTGVLDYGTDYSEFSGDYTQAFANFKAFVDLAHSYNIRIFIDIVPWGVSNYSPLVTEHADWFDGESDWGGMAYDLDNTDLQAWYKDAIIDTYLATGVDGIRWDLEPNYFGYDLVEQVRASLNNAGKKPLFFSEDINNRGDGAYAFEQCYGISGKGVGSQTVSEVFFNDVDIVKAIKNGEHIGVSSTRPNWATNGTAKYYAYQISSHDVIGYHNASLASWAYEYAFSSLIPIFYLGEEWNSSHTGGLTGVTIGWDELEEADHAEYYEAVKKLIGLRWMYKDMLNSNVDNHTNTNIVSVDVIGTDHVKGYARYADNEAIVVVPNVNEKSTADATFTIELPIADMNLSGYSNYTVTDMLTGDMVASGTAAEITYFSETIEHNTAGVYLVSGNASDVTWSMTEDGTLVVSGTGAVTDTPWAAAYTTAKAIVVEEGITSVPADAFANFGAVTTVTLPASLTTLPTVAEGATIIAPAGSAAATQAAAAGYEVVNTDSLEISAINVTVGDGSKTVDIVVDGKYAVLFPELKVVYGDNTVTEYTTVGKNIVFSFTTTDNEVSVKLAGADAAGNTAETDAVAVNLARMDGAAGTKYVQYVDLIGGDANGDGVTNIKDLVRTKKIIAGAETATDGADIDGNGSVVTTDLTMLAKLLIMGKKGMEACTVTFADYDGTVHEVINVPTGFKVVPTASPVRDGNALSKWDGDMTNITADVTIYAVYENGADTDFSEDEMSGTIPEDWEYDE